MRPSHKTINSNGKDAIFSYRQLNEVVGIFKDFTAEEGKGFRVLSDPFP